MTRPTNVAEFQEQVRSRKHDVRQLRMKLQSLRGDLQFDALLGLFADSKDDDSYNNQEMAGRLLLEVLPECHQPLDQILNSIAATWNASVEQLPLYLATTFGRDAVIARANLLSQALSNEDRKAKALDTIVWWLENRRAERRSEIRTNNPVKPSGESGVS